MTAAEWAACALFALVGGLAGSAWGPRWQWWLWGLVFGRYHARARHRLPDDDEMPVLLSPAGEPCAEPELTGRQRRELTSLVPWAASCASPAAIANGRQLADLIRVDGITGDLAAAAVLLAVIEYAHYVGDVAISAGLAHAEQAEVIGDAIAAAAVELTQLHRQADVWAAIPERGREEDA